MFEEGYSVYGKNIYKYNVETKNATLFFSAPAADKSVYGAGVQVDPYRRRMVDTLFKY